MSGSYTPESDMSNFFRWSGCVTANAYVRITVLGDRLARPVDMLTTQSGLDNPTTRTQCTRAVR
eukprot:1684903-Prymnesium_polylepis.1